METTRRDGEATRQRLMRAALELFTSVGFHGTTTPTIAERAGVAEGTIYRHFDSKDQLFNEVYRGTQRWAAHLVKELDSDPSLPAPDRLYRIAKRFVESAERDPAAIRMLLRPTNGRPLDQTSRDQARDFRRTLESIVAAGKADGLVRAGPADQWSAVWLTLLGFVLERVSNREWQPDAGQVEQTVRAAWDAIAAPTSAAG